MSSEVGAASPSPSKSRAKSSRAQDLRKDIPITEHMWPVDQVLRHYNVSLESGLTASQVQQQRQEFGLNLLTPPEKLPSWVKFLFQFRNFFAMLLIFGGCLCFVAYGIDSSDSTNLYLGVVLFGVVLITASFSHYQESRSEKIMEGFRSLIPKKCKVRRDGHQVIVDAAELVPGDIVDINDGDQVPADLRILQSTDLKVDNSSLTGESEPQERSADINHEIVSPDGSRHPLPPIEATNLLFYTTIVNSGYGRAVVIGTGDRTVMGQIAGLATETTAESTPINKDIKKFIPFISIVAVTLGVSFLSLEHICSAARLSLLQTGSLEFELDELNANIEVIEQIADESSIAPEMFDSPATECSSITLGVNLTLNEGTNLEQLTKRNAFECCEACQEMDSCNVWTQNRENGLCLLYHVISAIVTRIADSEIDLGDFTGLDVLTETLAVDDPMMQTIEAPDTSTTRAPDVETSEATTARITATIAADVVAQGSATDSGVTRTPRCQFNEGVTYPGGDVLAEGNGRSNTFCCELCRSSRNCNSWFHIRRNNRCILNRNIPDLVARRASRFVGGTIGS
eukprot:g8872.t1